MAANRGLQRQLSRRRLLGGGAALAAATAVGGVTASMVLNDRGPVPADHATPVPATTSPIPSPAALSPTASAQPPSVKDTLLPTAGVMRVTSWPNGDPIDWSHGVFLMNTRTGVVSGFQASAVDSSQSVGVNRVSPGGRFVYTVAQGPSENHVLHDRQTSLSYAWPGTPWRLNNWTNGLIVFEGVAAPGSVGVLDGRIEVVSADGLQTVTRANIPPSRWVLRSLFSPDGRALFAWALPVDAQPSLWRIDLASGRTDEAWRPAAADPTLWGDGGGLRPVPGGGLDAWLNWRPATSTGGFDLPAGVPASSRAALTWDGAVLDTGPAPEYFASRDFSPDGRFSLQPGFLRQVPPEADGPWERWSTVTLSREPEHVPLLRERSADLFYGDGLGSRRWLADSSGFLALIAGDGGEGWDAFAYGLFGTDGRLADRLPDPPVTRDVWFRQRMLYGPVPAPDDADLLSFGHLSVYRRSSQTWLTANLLSDGGPAHLDPWATEVSGEMAFALPHGGHGGAGGPSLLAPALERPPFDDSLQFRVSGTGSCLNLREGSGVDTALLQCLPEGTGLELGLRPGRSFEHTASGPWVRVMTALGVEGWVSAPYLAWDIHG